MAPIPRTTPASLSREGVVEAAIGLLRTQGLKGVTMRSVSAELGVTPMALYSHVESKEALVALVAAKAQESMPVLMLHEDGWQESLRRYLISIWEAVAPYPGLAAYMVNLPTMGASPASHASGTSLLEDAGFSPREAQLGWSFALTFIHGRLSIDARIDRDAARAAGLAEIRAREHALFGIEAVILGLRALVEGPLQAHPASA